MKSSNLRLDASRLVGQFRTAMVRGPLLWLTLGAAGVAHAAALPVPDTFTATTAAMTPSGVNLKIIVREWSDDAARAEVLAALGSEADVHAALASLPTVGYVWHAGSAIGYAVKYAHRTTSADGERVTFITDKLLGLYELKPWAAQAPSGAAALTYSVIELQLSGQGSGSGTLSLSADLQLDASTGVVSLAAKPGVPSLLTNAKLEPKPYWLEAH
jgi:hypothetical protein